MLCSHHFVPSKLSGALCIHQGAWAMHVHHVGENDAVLCHLVCAQNLVVMTHRDQCTLPGTHRMQLFISQAHTECSCSCWQNLAVAMFDPLVIYASCVLCCFNLLQHSKDLQEDYRRVHMGCLNERRTRRRKKRR